MRFYKIYKEKYHFSLNFYSIFLLVTFIPDILGLPASVITYGLWAIRSIAAFWIIIKYKKEIFQLSFVEQLYVFVALIYFINMSIDIFWQIRPMGMGNPRDLVGFFLSILVAFAFRYDVTIFSNRSFNFFLLTLFLGLLLAFFLAKVSPPPLIGRYDANSTVNTINYGQMGCALCLVSIFGFVKKSFKFSYLIYPLLFVLGIVSIMKAGSRSPIVVLAFVSIFYFFAKSGFVKGLILFGVSTMILYFSVGFLIELSEAVGSGIVTRIVSAVETGETSGRDAIYANAIGHFLDSPIFGNFYLIPSGEAMGFYPHNFLIEAFMTTGVVGGIPFVALILICLYKSFVILKVKHDSGWIVLLFLQTLIFGMFSSSLYSSQDFWALSFFIISMPPSILNKKRKFQKSITSSTAKQPSLGFS